MLSESARAYLSARDASSRRDLDTSWREFAELGWLALPVAEKHGGLGAPDSTLAVLMEELGRARALEPFSSTVVLAQGLLERLGGRYAEDTLASIARGERRLSVSMESDVFAQYSQSGWLLRGSVPLMIGAVVANTFLVPARDVHGSLRLFAIDHPAEGLEVKLVETIDDSSAADLTLVDVRAELVTEQEVDEALAWAFDRGAGLACADAVGAIGSLIDATVEYTRSRKQFGRPLVAFQVVEHQLVDMFILREEAIAATQLAIASPAADRLYFNRAVSAAKVKVGQAARVISHAAIQLHGAMGVTDELKVGRFVKRLMGFQAGWGTREAHLKRYASLLRDGSTAFGYLTRSAGTSVGAGINLDLEPAEREFQREVRTFLREAMPTRVSRGQQLTTMVYAELDIADEWHRILHRRGWSAPNWPAAFGGPGWTPTKRYLFVQESGAACAPTTSPIGLQLVGPVLMHFGDDAQKQRYLPPIVSGEELWCQGFSETGAGSDLAALATRAVRDGEAYVINGSKMWTTQGHVAHFMAALVRTGLATERRDGITFLLIDLRSPGIEIRPIDTIGADHEVNQVFFDQVRVPVSNRVGGEGQGWEIAKFLLEYERGGDIHSAEQRALLAELHAFARKGERDDEAEFWRALAEVSIDIDTLEMLELRTLLGAADTLAAPSMLKVRASETQQAITELAARALGREALRWYSKRPLCDVAGVEPEHAFTSRYLNSRAYTIFGGAREIQKSVIGRIVLPR